MNRLKPNVPDIESITLNHCIYAGLAGIKHYHLMINALLQDVGNTAIQEVNRAYACILFKGHGKNRFAANSYRTITTCPVVAKGLDMFIRDQYLEIWNKDQSSTQFQGSGNSHELASLLLTECIQFSSNALKLPTYVLYLDAKSAFDIVQKELLMKNLYHLLDEPDQLLLHINNRLANRQTILDWKGNLMGPILDQQGIGTGGDFLFRLL